MTKFGRFSPFIDGAALSAGKESEALVHPARATATKNIDIVLSIVFISSNKCPEKGILAQDAKKNGIIVQENPEAGISRAKELL